MPESSLDLLREAIGKKAAAVISLPVGEAFRHFKHRFLADGAEAFLVQAIASESALVEKVLAEGAHVGMAFRSGANKVIFTSVLRPRSAAEPAVRFPSNIRARCTSFSGARPIA